MSSNNHFDENLARAFGQANLMAKQYHDQFQRISESIAIFNSMSVKPFMQYQADSFFQLKESVALIQEKMGPNIDYLKTAAMALQTNIEAYQNSADNITRTINGFFKGAHELEEKMQLLIKVHDSIYEFSRKFDWSDLNDTPMIEVLESEEKEFVVQGNVVKLVDVEDKLNELTNRINSAITYDELIERIDVIIKNTTITPLKVILNFIIIIILSIASNMLTPHINNMFNRNDSRARIKVIQNIGREVLRDTPYNSKVRFVAVDHLNVRMESSRKSRRIDVLKLGQVVLIKYKHKNWAYIEYTNEDTNEIVNGWVFTRYLKRFKY